MSNKQPQLISQMFAFAEKQTLAIAEAIPAAIHFKALAPGKGHALWQMGHLAYALNNAGLRFVFNQPFVVPEDWIQRFGPDFRGGRAPVADPAAYPDWATVIEGYKASVAAFRENIATLEDADLSSPLRGPLPQIPPPPAHYKSIGGALGHLIQHDAYHRGQLGMIKSIG